MLNRKEKLELVSLFLKEHSNLNYDEFNSFDDATIELLDLVEDWAICPLNNGFVCNDYEYDESLDKKEEEETNIEQSDCDICEFYCDREYCCKEIYRIEE